MCTLRKPPVWRLALLLLAALAAGCGEDGSPIPGIDLGDTSPGEPDKPKASGLVIDEAGMHATVEGDTLVVVVPLSSTQGRRVGSVEAAVRLVDGSETAATAEAAYDLDGHGTTDVELRVPLPDVQTQADLVRWVVRVEDTGPGQEDRARVTRSLLHLLPLWEVVLEGPKTVVAGRSAAWRVRAQDPVQHLPLADVPVGLVIEGKGGPVEREATTDPSGVAVFPLDVPDEGTWPVTATGASHGVEAQVTDQVVATGSPNKVLLTTDKPIYRPGQTMHLRALSLAKPDLAPVTGSAVTFEVEDGKGNKVLKREVATDGWGIAATTFQIGSIVNEGTYAVRAILGETATQKAVEVTTYALPKFQVAVSLTTPWALPGQTVEGVVDADYFFGKPVAGGTVTIEAAALDVGGEPFARITGKTDAEGRMEFAVKLPDVLVGLPLEQGKALVQLAVTVTDTADQAVERSVALVVSAKPAQILVVPEGGHLVPGAENQVHIFVSDPLGAPIAGAEVRLTDALGREVELTTDGFGYAAALVDVPLGSLGSTAPLSVTAWLPTGGKVTVTAQVGVQGGFEHVLVRTDKAVYEVGETVTVQIVTSSPAEFVYLDWLNQGQVVDMRTVETEGGLATTTLDLDAGLLGDNTIEAYIVDLEGQVVRASRMLFVRDARSLTVSLGTDKPQYGPGEEATLTFTVQTEQGEPTAAALGVQIVDEAVFALVDAQPGLLKTYFELTDALAEPQVEIHGATWSLTEVLFEQAGGAEDEAAQRKAAASFAALPVGGVTGMHGSSWQALPALTGAALEPFWAAEREDLRVIYQAATRVASEALEAKGCAATDPWCEALGKHYVKALTAELGDRITVWDFWGAAYELTSADWEVRLTLRSRGADEALGTPDDWSVTFDHDDLGLPAFRVDGNGSGGGWADSGAAAGDTGGGGHGGGADGGEGPRVRKSFPETLYVNPALIAGGDGKAQVTLPLADSITEWRVTSLAHSLDGRLGSGVAGVTVFQDFFVDISFPATLTRGDEVTFPIAVYNYLDEPQSVSLTLEPAGWYTALGETQVDLTIGPQQVVGAKFPVRVDTVGIHGLTVTGLGSKLSDAVHRTVKVVPDGKEIATVHAGAMAAGTVEADVSFPAEAVPGSEVLYVNVYPAYLSQAVEGLDAMLSVPYG